MIRALLVNLRCDADIYNEFGKTRFKGIDSLIDKLDRLRISLSEEVNDPTDPFGYGDPNRKSQDIGDKVYEQLWTEYNQN